MSYEQLENSVNQKIKSIILKRNHMIIIKHTHRMYKIMKHTYTHTCTLTLTHAIHLILHNMFFMYISMFGTNVKKALGANFCKCILKYFKI